MIVVHGRASSSNVQKVLWALGELGRPYRIVERGREHGGLDDPEFRELTPFRLIPVIDDEGLVVVESGAILRHLGRGPGGHHLWPVDDAQALAHAEGVMDWCSFTLWPAVRAPFLAVAREGASRSDEALGKQVAAIAGPITALTALLEARDWLSGDAFGLADIPAAVILSRLVWLVGRQALPPEVGAWYDACSEREAFKAVVSVQE